MASDGILPDGTALGIVQLKVRDLEQAASFYHGLLGLEITSQSARSLTLAAGERDLLSLVSNPEIKSKPARTTGLYHFALLLPDQSALGWALRKLLEADYPLQGAADHWVSEALYLSDPEGNGIEIYRDRPRAEWPRDGDRLLMATEPLQYEAVFTAGEGGGGTLLPASTRMGHVHLHVGDLSRAEAFYGSGLGFERTTGFGRQAAFYSVAGYHHHLGLNTWAGVGAPRPPGQSAGLDWFELILPHADGRAALERRLAGQGIAFQAKADGLRLEDPSGNGLRVRVEGG